MPEAKPRHKRNFYTVLGVDRTADDAAIKKAYRSAALRWHPDKNRGGGKEEEAERRFKEIAEAYDVLSDGAKRRLYDATHHPRPSAAQPHFHYSARSPFDVFKEFFGSRDPFEELFADFFNGHHPHFTEPFFAAHHRPQKQRVSPWESKVERDGFFTSDFYADEEENDENRGTTTSFSFTGKPGEPAAARKTSTSTRTVNGKKVVTKKTEEGGKETIEVLEDGLLTSRTVNAQVNTQ